VQPRQPRAEPQCHESRSLHAGESISILAADSHRMERHGLTTLGRAAPAGGNGQVMIILLTDMT